MPPTASVTPCSTCRRVLTSRNPEAAAVGVVDEFHRAGGAVLHGAAKPFGRCMQRGAGGIGETRSRCFLDHFLVATLHGADALAQRHYIATAIAEQLHFDMACAGHVLLQEQATIAEVAGCKASHALEGARELLGEPHSCMPMPAAACGALQHHRVADAGRRHLRAREVGEQATARQQRQAILFGQFTRAVLEPEVAHLRWRGTDEGDARRRTAFGEAGVLREEAVAGMNGLGAAALRDFQQRLLS